ncbi:histidine kinase [Verrucomicrobium sp. BvORR106]|uniref:sensor histidine kinase n=1 Tax=Verrucomicrobium sp. BvORR106 TaxID=1403819 RepID=UPI002240E958|nr:histidine kinase [Verrucomicrobium sp. BvORR106]
MNPDVPASVAIVQGGGPGRPAQETGPLDDDLRFERTTKVVNVLLWPVLAILFATQFKFSAAQSWTFALIFGTMLWLPWMLLTPVIVRGVKRWCMTPHHLAMDMLAWTVGMVLCVGFYAVVAEAGMDEARGKAREPQRPPPSSWRENSPPPRPPMFLPQVLVGMPVYLGITAFAVMSVARVKMRERERRVLQATAELHRSRLEMLYAQLRPHFLFNTLNTIASLVHREPEVVDRIVTSLGVLLHETLESDVNREVTLEHEIELVEMYLKIERARFGDGLKLTTDIEADCLMWMVPVLILQPVVENAVRHGLGPRKGVGTIAIKARIEPERQMLRLEVRDDGVGIKEPLRDGIGLENTRARLRAAYGDLEGLDERVTVLPCEEGGSIAVIEIPHGRRL